MQLVGVVTLQDQLGGAISFVEAVVSKRIDRFRNLRWYSCFIMKLNRNEYHAPYLTIGWGDLLLSQLNLR